MSNEDVKSGSIPLPKKNESVKKAKTDFSMVNIICSNEPNSNYVLFAKILERVESRLKAKIFLTDFDDRYLIGLYVSYDQVSGLESTSAFRIGCVKDVDRDVEYKFALEPLAPKKYKLTWRMIKYQNGSELFSQIVDSVELQPAKQKKILPKLMSDVVNKYHTMFKKIQVMKEENVQLKITSARAVEDLKTFTEQKDSSYRELYNRFAALLNQKKRRIRELLESGYTFGRENKRRAWVHRRKSQDGSGPLKSPKSETASSSSDIHSKARSSTTSI